MEKSRLKLGIDSRRVNPTVTWEETPEASFIRSLKLVPHFDEEKVTEWLVRFEKKAREFEWPRQR